MVRKKKTGPQARSKPAKKSGSTKRYAVHKRIIYRIILIVNSLLAILLLLSYLSPHIHPEKSTIPSFLGLSYPLLALINLGFVLFWLFFFRPYFIISLVALIAGLNHVSAYFQIHSPVELSERNIVAKVMSYNVQMFNLFQWNKDEKSLSGILQAVEDQAPDILCIQEFYQDKQSRNSIGKRIRKIHKLEKTHIKYWRETEKHGFGMATFTSLPIARREELLVQEDPKMYALVTDVVSGADTLRVFNIHLSSYNFGKHDYEIVEGIIEKKDATSIRSGSLRVLRKLHQGFKARGRQADLIGEAVAASPYPVIVCGDFNEVPSGYAYNRIKSGLKDAFMESGAGLGRSYKGIFPSYRIDYILHDPVYQSINFKVYDYTGSDHNPIVAYITKPVN